jgi:hypothetical protein
MSLTDEFSDALAEEVLSDVAATFFGARRNLDAAIELFEGYVQALKKKGDSVSARLRFLNHLLLEDAEREAFFRAMHVQCAEAMRASGVCGKALPEKAPAALSARGCYVKLVSRSYRALFKDWCDYVGESPEPPRNCPSAQAPVDVSYRLVENMSRMVNEMIRKVNTGMSMTGVLQYAKRLQPDLLEKEALTGGGLGAPVQLRPPASPYRPIVMETLGLVQYPVFPAPEKINERLTAFCESLYSRHKSAVKTMLADLSAQIRHRCHEKKDPPYNAE